MMQRGEQGCVYVLRDNCICNVETATGGSIEIRDREKGIMKAVRRLADTRARTGRSMIPDGARKRFHKGDTVAAGRNAIAGNSSILPSSSRGSWWWSTCAYKDAPERLGKPKPSRNPRRKKLRERARSRQEREWEK